MMRSTSVQKTARIPRQRMSLLLLVSVLSVGLGTLASLNAQSLTWLGTLPDTDVSQGWGVSADGTVVVGRSFRSNYYRAFRWTPEEGMQNLGTLGGDYSWALDVSADGTVVVGQSLLGYAVGGINPWRAFRWTPEEGMQDLGTLPGGRQSWAEGVSADGRVIVGRAETALTSTGRDIRAVRWVDGVIQELGTLGGRHSWAHAVSLDGRVIVGRAMDASGIYRAFRWTPEDGMQNLHTLPNADQSYAYAVSADGNVVVGWTFNPQTGRQRAFRWTPETGMQELVTPPEWGHTEAWGVSADGMVIVGLAQYRGGIRWTPVCGAEVLSEIFASLLTDGSVLVNAYAISPDGRYIVGVGYNASTGRGEAYLLDTALLCVVGTGQDGSDGGQDGSDGGQDGSDGGQDGSDGGQDGSDGGQDGSDGGQDGSDGGQDGSDGGQDGSDGGQDGSDGGQDGSDGGQDGSDGGQDGSDGGQDDCPQLVVSEPVAVGTPLPLQFTDASGASSVQFEVYDSHGNQVYYAFAEPVSDGDGISWVWTWTPPFADTFTIWAVRDGVTRCEVMKVPVYQPDASGSITGGGWLEWQGERQLFGFVAQVQRNGRLQGSLEYQTPGRRLNLKSYAIDWVYAPNASEGYFSGWATLNGEGSYRFWVAVWDGDSSGTHDQFWLWVYNGDQLVYRAWGPLAGGNLRVHSR